MLKLSTKKSASHLNFRAKRPKHPWDVFAEQTKAKHNETSKMTQRTEETLSKSSQVIVDPVDLSPEQDLESDMHLADYSVSPNEGFFPCPFCTCWFTHKKDLNLHVKKWCDRARSNLIVFTKSK